MPVLRLGLDRSALLLPLFAFLFFAPGHCLCGQDARPRARAEAPFYWSVNVGTATASALLHGRFRKVPVYRAVIAGVAGGTLMYAGQRMVGSGVPALRFAGLQTVATGASLTRNLSRGDPAFTELTFPVFPAYLQVRPTSHPHVRVRVSAVAVGGMIHTAREFHVWPDWQESLVAGMPVFQVDRVRLGPCVEYDRFNRCIGGMIGHHVFGAVAFTSHNDAFSGRNVLTHELGHAAQDMRDAVLDAVPVSDAALERLPGGHLLSRFLVVDLVLPLSLASRIAGPPGVDPACRALGSYYECETEAMMTSVP
jgi:hypothetical protein